MEAMGWFRHYDPKARFKRFEKAAMKGHEESQWIWNVAKDMELTRGNWGAIVKAFAETENPLGFYIAGFHCGYWDRPRFDYMKKSSDGGCSWGQLEYGRYFQPGDARGKVTADKKLYLELIDKAVVQNNPDALCLRGWRHKEQENVEEALLCYRTAVELGWREAEEKLSEMFYTGRGVEKDLVQAIHWGSELDGDRFWKTLREAAKAWNDKAFGDLGCDFNRLSMEIGKGLYWCQYGTWRWEKEDETEQRFGIKCLDYYCETIELQREAIFLFLFFWNKATGVKGPGQMIGQMVWEGRYDCLVKEFREEPPRRSARLKRLKK